MRILGLNAFWHDAAAALVEDGALVSAAQEERFSRVKHDGQFPERAIRFCLRHSNLRGPDLDGVAFYWHPWRGLLPQVRHALRWFPASLALAGPRASPFWQQMRIRARLRDVLGLPSAARVLMVPHHAAHAASAFYPSPFTRAAVLTIDATGEWTTTGLGLGDGTRLTTLREIGFPHSLGLLYAAMTEYLGFRMVHDEQKVMALAGTVPGAPRALDLMRRLVRLEPDGTFRLDLDWFEFHKYGRPRWFSEKFIRAAGPPRAPGGPLEDRHADLAAALQTVTEDTTFHLLRWLHGRTGADAVCLAGGVALNSVLNGKIRAATPFREVFIPPAAGDAGTAYGAAAWAAHAIAGEIRRTVLTHDLWGPETRADDIARAIAGRRLPSRTLADPPREAARLLADGKVIGWVQGRMEYGPRALGARSILADPRRAEMKDRLNRLKQREPFQPFAPAVPLERAGEWFEDSRPSPFMLMVTKVRPEKRSVIPAVTHADGSARIQTVAQRAAPAFHALLEAFGNLTGVPVVLNTSLNLPGQPIACTAEDALDVFSRMPLDALVLGDRLIAYSVRAPE